MIKKILILGETGRLGGYLASSLSKKYKVSVPSNRHSIESLTISGVIKLSVSIDALNQQGFDELILESKPDVVINCIAVTPDRMTSLGTASTILINSVFPHYIHEICKRYSIKLIHFSTDAVFSGNRGFYNEDSPTCPQGVYGQTKLLGEIVEDDCLTFRTSFFGPTANSRGLVDWLISKKGQSINGYQNYIFSGISLAALSRTIDEIINIDYGLKGIYHLGGPRISKLNLLKEISKSLDLGITVNSLPEPNVDLSLDSSKFYKKTNLIPPSLCQIVDDIRCDTYQLGII